MDNQKIWKEVLATIRVSVSPANFSTWLSQTFIVSVKKLGTDRQIVEIGCSSSYIADTLQRRYFGLLQDSLNQTTGLKNDLVFVVKNNPAQKQKTILDNPLFSSQQTEEQSIKEILHKARVQPGFTFENFAVSSTNQMAHAAAEAVSENPGTAYNPLFIWGGTGVGKTHLMLAIAQRVLRQNPEARVLYCMGEEFTSEIVDAIRNKNTQVFKNRYRKLDLLMLDDVQFLAGKVAAQEEFFHTFNTLLREGGQVLLTSDRPPSEIQKMEQRLVGRFEAGLVIDISPPDFELRTAIALIKAAARGVSLPMDVAQTIAAGIENPRKIEGFITRVLTQTNNSANKISVDFVTELMSKTNKNASTNTPKKHLLPQDVISAVSTYFDLRKKKLLGSSRARPVAIPRQILMYLLRVELRMTLEEVGGLTGNRDHTTVMYAVNKISRELSTNNTLRNNILGIKQSIS